VTDYHLDEIEVRRTIIANTSRRLILADSSKMGHVAPHRVCDLAALSGLITETAPPPAVAAAFEKAGGTVLSA
jgi:DeoR family glycerol-3-phosphate regulon repressor